MISFLDYYIEQFKELPIGWRLAKKHKLYSEFFLSIPMLLDPLCIYTMYLYDTGQLKIDKRYQKSEEK